MRNSEIWPGMEFSELRLGDYASAIWPFFQECATIPAAEVPGALSRHVFTAVGAAAVAVHVAKDPRAEATCVASHGLSRMDGEASVLIREAVRTRKARFFDLGRLALFEDAGDAIAGACIPFHRAGEEETYVLMVQRRPGDPDFSDAEQNLLLLFVSVARFQAPSAEPGRRVSAPASFTPETHDPDARRLRHGLHHLYPSIVGESPAVIEMLHELDFVLGCDGSVFIFGESGTGKELVARAIATEGKRSGKPFEAHNVSAVPGELFESQFLGYEKGAFYGAEKTTPGAFERCDTGTMFLDEIGDLRLDHQPKVLRVVEYQELFRLGGRNPVKLDVRIVTATCKDIDGLVTGGRFREDLCFRLDDERITVPPLRDRKSDIPLLLHYRFGTRASVFGREALAALTAWDWPGNIRELFQVARRVINRLLARGSATATANDISRQLRRRRSGGCEEIASIHGRAFKSLPRAEKKEILLREIEREGWTLGSLVRKFGYRRYSLTRLLDSLQIPWRQCHPG